MGLITIMIPTYNELDNVNEIYKEVTNIMNSVKNHTYEIMFVDNFSTDGTRDKILNICNQDTRVKAIFNAKNFGYSRSLFYGLTQAEGDCAILLHADMQNPPSLIPTFISNWDDGYKVVIGIKNKSKENKFMYFIRTCYYKLMKHICEIEQIEHFTEYELLDRSFLNVLKEIDDPLPYLRGIVSEFGFNMKKVYFIQEKRKKGKSFSNFMKSYDFAMLGITSYSKVLMRISTILGFIMSFISIIVGAIIFIQKLIAWDSFPLGTAAIAVGVFFFGSVILFFLGFMGEYILNMNIRIMHRPLVIEEKRLNFKDESE